MVMKNLKANMCGGQHQNTLNAWKKILDAFKATGCKLVFVADANIQKDKIIKWLVKRNAEFNKYIRFYDAITNEEYGPSKAVEIFEKTPWEFVLYGMAAIAQSYGEFTFSIKREADVEIVMQAKHRGAMAIISNDSDFLIFGGKWKLWLSDGIVRSKLRLATFEYTPIRKVLSLSAAQLPVTM